MTIVENLAQRFPTISDDKKGAFLLESIRSRSSTLTCVIVDTLFVGSKNTLHWYTEMVNKDRTWLREISSCCCLTPAGKTRQLLLNKIYIPFCRLCILHANDLLSFGDLRSIGGSSVSVQARGGLVIWLPLPFPILMG